MKGTWVFDTIVEELHGCSEKLPDNRTGENTQYEIKDAVLSSFGVFFAQAASFLAYQRLMAENKGGNNLQNLFRVEAIPSDNQIRNLLDGLEPGLLASVFAHSLQELEAVGVVDKFRSYDDRILISCDGTQTVSSQKVCCQNCSRCELANGETLYPHTAILAVIVKAGESRVIALESNFWLKMGWSSNFRPASGADAFGKFTSIASSTRCLCVAERMLCRSTGVKSLSPGETPADGCITTPSSPIPIWRQKM